jgi:hypothetical protein
MLDALRPTRWAVHATRPPPSPLRLPNQPHAPPFGRRVQTRNFETSSRFGNTTVDHRNQRTPRAARATIGSRRGRCGTPCPRQHIADGLKQRALPVRTR